MNKKYGLSKKHRTALILAFIFLTALFPLIANNSFLISIGCYVLFYAILSMGNMLTVGYGGMLNMAQAAFCGIGAYTTAILSTRTGVSFMGCLFFSSLAAAFMGFLISVPCLRVRSDFLGLITLAFHQLYTAVAENWLSFTNGPMGIRNIPKPSLLGLHCSSQRAFFCLFLVMTGLAWVIMKRFVNSPAGRATQAVRDDEICAESVGIRKNYYKVISFVVGAAFAGMAGCLYASYVGYVGSSTFTLETTFLLLEMNIVGGLGSLDGALFGAVFFTVIPEIIRPLAVYRVGAGGLLMILVVLIRPQGVFGSEAFSGNGGILHTNTKRIGNLLKKRVSAKGSMIDRRGA